MLPIFFHMQCTDTKSQLSKSQAQNPSAGAVAGSQAPVSEPSTPGSPLFAALAGESDRAFEAFRSERELGPQRRYAAAARKVGASLRTVKRTIGRAASMRAPLNPPANSSKPRALSIVKTCSTPPRAESVKP